jgi:hypothetical protein
MRKLHPFYKTPNISDHFTATNALVKSVADNNQKTAWSVIRRFGAQPDKMIVDRQTASPSSWKTPCIATRMAW